MTFSNETRREHLTKMTTTPLDILIIGGGLTGAGIALDAISRGLGVAVVEMADFSSGSSNNTTPILAGAALYSDSLELTASGNLGKERELSYENGPHVSTPVSMLLPFYPNTRFTKVTTPLKLTSYDFLAGVTKENQHFTLTRKDTIKREPLLKTAQLNGSAVYVDYRREDNRMTLETLKKAAEFGAYIANYTKVEKLLYSNKNQKVIGARVRDRLTNQESTIYAKRVINAAGPWADQIRQLDQSKSTEDTYFVKNTHIVVSASALPLTSAVTVESPFDDQQMIIALPRGGKTYVGTTKKTAYFDDSSKSITLAEVTYLIQAVSALLAIDSLPLTAIESAWADSHLQQKERNQFLNDPLILAESGLYSVIRAGFIADRKIAERVVNTVLRDICKEYDRLFIKCRTKTLRLSGGEVGGSEGFKRYTKEFVKIGIEKFHLSNKDANLLVKRYGSNVIDLFAYLLNVPEYCNLADVDFVQLRYALEEEMALHPVDFLLRRTGYMLYDMSHCLKIQEEVILVMASYYQWSPAYIEQVTRETEEEIKQHLVC